MAETTESLVQTLRRRLEGVRRRQWASHRQAHEFAVRRLDARLVSRKKPNALREGLQPDRRTQVGWEQGEEK